MIDLWSCVNHAVRGTVVPAKCGFNPTFPTVSVSVRQAPSNKNIRRCIWGYPGPGMFPSLQRLDAVFDDAYVLGFVLIHYQV